MKKKKKFRHEIYLLLKKIQIYSRLSPLIASIDFSFFEFRITFFINLKRRISVVFFFLTNLSKHRDLPNNSFYIIEARNEETGNTLDGLK